VASAYPKGGRWYLRYKDGQGRWRSEASKARTKSEARRLAADLEAKGERERKGLEVGEGAAADWTLTELLRWWLKTYSAGLPSHRTNEGAINGHLAAGDLGRLQVRHVTSGHLEGLLHEKSRTLAPETLNHLRGYVSRAYNCARRIGLFRGTNPAADVQKRRVPRRMPDYLRAEEVAPVLSALSDRWRALFTCAVFTGLRKGELAGLRKADVDLDARLLTVRRSWDRETTKGGHADVIPIAAELVPSLRAAIEASPSELVFPGLKGAMMSRRTQLELVLRRALKAAGIVVGYQHKCRAKACGFMEPAPDQNLRRCPKHRRQLWVVAQARPIRFHDLRHTTASLLMMRGANPAAVQRILRHSDPKLTTEVYGHLAPGYLRAEVDRLAFGLGAPEDDEAEDTRQRAIAGAFATPLLPDADRDISKASTRSAFPEAFPMPALERDTGLEPATFSLGTR
jgi:integrase